MAALLFFLLSSLCMAAAQPRQSNITRGSWLTPTNKTSWLSPSGLYAFGFYQLPSGYAIGVFVAGIPLKTVVWTANRDNAIVSDNATLLFTTDGKLVVRTKESQVVYIATSESASSASMLDSGNFVLYNSERQIIWQSFDHPTDTLLPGQHLSATKELFSSISETNPSTGIFILIVQQDGWLVQYPVAAPYAQAYAYWTTGTPGAGSNVTLNLDDDGHLYLFISSSFIFNISEGRQPKGRTIYRLKIDADGILRLYSNDLDQKDKWSNIWSSVSDKCAPKGICGLNTFCSVTNDEVNCGCLPGFESIFPEDSKAGCKRNFMAGSCHNKAVNMADTMRPLDNTLWLDNSYASLATSVKEDCARACLEDCNCEAAVFKNGECKKHGLPLRYGKRDLGDSSVAFVRMATSVPTMTGLPSDQELPPPPKKELRKDILTVSILLVALAFILLATSGALIHNNSVWAYEKISEAKNLKLREAFGPRAFTYAELEQVTNGFKEEVGRGAFGTVFKGTIPTNQKMVAVKRLDKVLAEQEREFQNEMKVIGKTHHRNLVVLLGYCIDRQKRLLVYEYMSNGSLADILGAPEIQLSWDERTGIALDIARGLLYLHEECEKQIIHCDIKPQNILMDEHMRARISDFGLAKLLKHDQAQTTTGIRGTRGYVAPEWHKKLPVTVKADVYSFGIVLFEIICRRRSVDWSLPEDEAVLEEWVYSCFQAGQLSKLVGDEEVDKRKLERMVSIGIWCIQDEPSLRPSMKKVLMMLEGTVDIPVPPNPTDFLGTV